MNLLEQKMWRELEPNLKSYRGTRFRRIENGSMARGMSDIAFTIHEQPHLKPPTRVRGWIELKFLKSMAVGSSYDLGHLTEAQKKFLNEEQMMAGNTWLLMHSDTLEWYLVSGDRALELGTRPTHKELKMLSSGHWSAKLNYDELIKILKTWG